MGETQGQCKPSCLDKWVDSAVVGSKSGWRGVEGEQKRENISWQLDLLLTVLLYSSGS